jgi:hypothetical protein
MRKGIFAVFCTFFLFISLVWAPWMHGQDGDRKADIQKKLSSQFVLAKLTADGSDIVTAGSVLALQKNGFQMCSIAFPPPTSSYKDGSISIGFGDRMSWAMKLPMGAKAAPATVPQRKFVSGEKFWVTGIDVQDDGVVFQVYSDPYPDVRYWGRLKFSYSKKSIPSADALLKTIAEVLTVQPNDNASENASQQLAPEQTAEPAQEQALALITPPPPPADTPPPPPADTPPPPPKTISLGQTRDEVVAILGQPQKVVKLATKEMLYYPDMKVTLVKAKVADVQ